ncbi:C1GALT1-specific chaperone 1 [Triplophysa rosa]|uniref:C1GALT1-specific chaperone 1 n=1 Tax=Triplophysa rosa TaxID=992332 RepID=A0A9W7TTT7_TRIRA|nr:C1GALT1-specific chaperone 1 [Triplophysa rosa]XP_057205256.1 C1GALT1-specific chaperone 1 [Triplophysa rosa]XP_057205257.1 C1GALT1-specific chaperone 1 [Triplophysa rosa]XP_057205258.1 C1GALT1-specific chaperone 1 [Triplophysa rosa]KAI7801894.1 putative C1GALT1-specific chaperone 1 [Triplophysa rosa]
MMSEGCSFMKGMFLGGIFCLVMSLFGTFSPGPQGDGHLHHHLKPVSKDELQKLSEAQMYDLTQQVRVYCVIMVTPKLLVYWATANDTWSKHCDKSVFYTSESSKALEALDLQEDDEWARLRKAITHAYENAGDLRWFFVARPTTFAIIENLKYLVLEKDPSQPFYIGRTEKSGELEYVEYDGGIVLSYEAMKRLVEIFKDEEKCPARGHALWKMSEEKQLATCLKYSGVFAENGEDAQGKSLFNKKSVTSMISDSMGKNPNDVVESCCSDLAITFGGMPAGQMQVMMYGVYRLRPYGHDFHDSLTFLPPKDSDND